MNNPLITLIGAGCGWGAQRPQTQWGPRTLLELGLEQVLAQYGTLNWQKMLLPSLIYSGENALNYEQRLEQVASFTQELAQEVIKAQQKDLFPVVLGGDHSVAIGTWSGMITALQAHRKFGLIWMDAHMDSHTVETTPSYNIHGMPLATLLGYGEPSLTQIASPGPKLDPQHVVLIGVRSFETGEAELLEKLNVKIFFMEEVKRRGFDHVFASAVKHVCAKTKGFGISIDMDVFDPKEAPGTGTPVAGGLASAPVCKALYNLVHNPMFKALEIVEFDPVLDEKHQTAYLIQNIILSILGLGK